MLQAQTASPTITTQQTPATLSATNVFSSEWGFDMTYPSDWNVTDLRPAAPIMKLESENRKNCTQRIFQAAVGAPASSFSAIGQTTQCTGSKSSLSDMAVATVAAIKKDSRLSDTEYGAYSIHGVDFWVMRSKAVKIEHPNDVQTLEKVIAILPGGVVYWTAFCKDEAAQKQFEHLHLHLADGGDSEMVPATAFHNAAAAETTPQEKK